MNHWVIVFLALLTLTACGSVDMPGSTPNPSAEPSATSQPLDPSAITGVITQLGDRMLVEEQPGQANAGNKIVFQINAATELFVQDGDQRRTITQDALQTGWRVEVWATGPILESYPGQATAARIVVLEQQNAAEVQTPSPDGEVQSPIPPVEATIVGTITEITDRILIEEFAGATIGNKIYFSLDEETSIFQHVGQETQPRNVVDLAVGQRVEAWSNGAVAESFPAQATASKLVLDDTSIITQPQYIPPPERKPDVEGVITQASNTIWIDNNLVLFVTPSTQFWEQSGDISFPINASAIREGQRVAVWTDTINYSGTPQATAITITVITY